MIDSIKFSSDADEITFFEDRARIKRVARGRVEAGASNISVPGISVLIDDPGLVVQVVTSGVSVQAAQVRRLMRNANASDDAAIQALNTRRQDAVRARRQAAQRVEELRIDRDKLVGLEESLLSQMSSVPKGDAGSPVAWGKAYSELDERLDKVQSGLREVRSELARADREERRSQLLWEYATMVQPELRAEVEIQLHASAAGEVELVLEYVVPCALWRPSHRARLVRGESASLEIKTLATLWQVAGERWDNVQCVFSTARLSKPSSPPLIEDDYLAARRKSAEEQKTIQVDAREEQIMRLDKGGNRAVDEMPGIDDGGRPLTFRAVERVTIPSDGKPFQVEVGQVQLRAEVQTVAYSELGKAPVLKAKATWSAPYPLLAGPVELMREQEFAGRSRTDFVAVGDVLEIGFGPMSGLSISRRVDEKRDKTLLGKHTITRTINIYLSNLSGEERAFELVERIPVSEIDEVEVKCDPAYRADRDGFIHVPIKLAPQKTLKKVITYTVEHPSKVNLSF